jgi:dTDP-4-dehydrorhamnose 3,5-epimerase
MLEVRPLGLDGVLEIVPRRFQDPRGFFSEVHNAARFREHGIDLDFVQDNHSYSAPRGTLRGLHFQTPPFAQAKLVRVLRGAVFDVAVDIRKGSPDFGKWVGVTLTPQSWNQILVPVGFAHGFLTLEPDTEVFYKVTAPYSPAHDRAIRFNDPSIAIAWPAIGEAFAISEKDNAAPLLSDIDTEFVYPAS